MRAKRRAVELVTIANVPVQAGELFHRSNITLLLTLLYSK
jgi:hypothetical protein